MERQKRLGVPPRTFQRTENVELSGDQTCTNLDFLDSHMGFQATKNESNFDQTSIPSVERESPSLSLAFTDSTEMN